MVYLPRLIPRVPSNLSLRFKATDFKYTALELDGGSTPPAGSRGCSQRLNWKTMSVKMRVATVVLLVGICVAIQTTIILLIRGHYRRVSRPTTPEIPESVRFPWRQFPEYPPPSGHLLRVLTFAD